MNDEVMRVSLPDQIAEVKRELAMRRRVYVREIERDRMTAEEAERRTLTMAAVLRTLEWVRDQRAAADAAREAIDREGL